MNISANRPRPDAPQTKSSIAADVLGVVALVLVALMVLGAFACGVSGAVG